MNNSLKNILLSEDTGEELKTKGYTKISNTKKDEYEKKGCQVVQSDSGTLYAKCTNTIKPAPSPGQPAPAKPKTDQPAPAQTGTGDNPLYTEIEKDYPKIAIYSRLFIFLTKDGPFYLNSQEKEFGDILVKTNDKKMQLGYNLPTAFIKSVIETYPQIIKVSVPEKIGNDKVELQFEFFTRIKGLQNILEQAQTPTKYITYNIVDSKLKQPTENDNYIDGSNKTIKFIAGSSKTFLSVGERSGTVTEIKKILGYDKDTTPYFTQDFDEFLIKYKGTNGMTNPNGNIDHDLICSIEQYKRYCPATGAEKTTAPPTSTTPTSTTESTPEMKSLNYLVNAVGNGIPAYGPCKLLFDYYSEQALIYTRTKKVKMPLPTDTEVIKKEKEEKLKLENDKLMKLLQPIKDKITYCQKSSDLKDRAKLDTLISQRFRIQQDKNSPYYVEI
jgi:hypothetical protein